MTTIAIAIRNSDGYKMVTMAEGRWYDIGQTLKTHYTTGEVINELLDKGNIVTLGNTVSESVFTGTPPTIIQSIDQRESEITTMDKNFYFNDTKWLVRSFGKDYYTDVE